ncbi:glycosyltransferase family 2 protein [Paeniglutamicibacter antarcticus]|uniref:Glycosyltransferase family 2 protein n=1 Tax=Arthrobacter terrae TaxID=2935737 RepID=A0A931CLD4_9MICC|nr:glycosyltransferase family 2 protein [Arthrobacter terrae]MBG0738290.1 glycosyltransferase family 2 protein [Arthrobacter terrae]
MPAAVSVTAVVIAHNGSKYLPRILAAVAAQTRPADAVFGADTGSSDGSLKLLEDALGKGKVITHSSFRGGFGSAVQDVVRQLSAPAQTEGEHEWLWLLHDDSAPAPDALAELLQAVERAPSVTVAGCKQLDWDEPRKLIDVGLSASRWAERVTLIDRDEHDQGQHDGRSDVFAVNSAGMLVRRDIWEKLDGFDPAVPGTGDDIDFCWRNRLAGHRVVVVPRAGMRHVSRRQRSVASPKAARKAEVHLRLKHAPLWQVPFLAIGALLGGVFRLLAGIVLKEPGYGARQFTGTCAALARPLILRRSRAAAARTRVLPRSVMGALQAGDREIRSHRRSLLDSFTDADADADDPAGDGSVQFVPSGDAADDFAALSTANRLPPATGAVAAVVLLLAVGLLCLYRLVGAGAVAGGGLLPLSAGLGGIWHNASTWWIAVGAGLPGHGDPFGYVLWLLALAGLGNGSAAVAWLLILALPLAGLGAWFAAGALTRHRWARFAAAVIWASAPALQIAIGQGRLGALLAHILIPWVLLGLIRAVGGSVLRRGAAVQPPARRSAAGPSRTIIVGPGRPGSGHVPSWTAAAAAGLGLAIITASAPSLLPGAVVGIILAMVFLRRRGRTLFWALLPSIALFVPFVISTLNQPRAIFADPGVPLAYTNAPLWQQILGQPVRIGSGAGINSLSWFPGGAFPWALTAMIVVGGPVLSLAVCALLIKTRRAGLVRALWGVAVLALLSGFFSASIAVALGGTSLVTPFSGPSVSLTAFALLAAALLGVDALLQGARSSARSPAGARRSGAFRGTAVLISVFLVISPVASLSLWVAQNLAHGADQRTTAADPARAPLGQDAGTQSDITNLGVETGPTDEQYGVSTLVRPGSARTLPATATDRGNGPERARTLVLSINSDASVSAALMRGAGTTMDSLSTIASARGITGAPGAESVQGDDPAGASIRQAVATIMAGTGVDPRPQLTELGVGFVVLHNGDTAAELMASQIEAVPGLATVGPTDVGWLWRVTPDAVSGPTPEVGSRVRITDPSGVTLSYLPSDVLNVDTQIMPGAADRRLVLAERADAGWAAWLDGRQLASRTSDWAQAFTLPASGGHLVVRYENPWAGLWSILQIVVLGLTVLMAIPMPARRRRSSAGSTVASVVGNRSSDPVADGDATVEAGAGAPAARDALTKAAADYESALGKVGTHG